MKKVTTNKPKDTQIISKCNTYQYQRKIVWDKDKPLVLFVGLNPEVTPQPLVVKGVANYAKDLGFGGFYIGNLFAYLSDNFMPLTTMGREKITGKYNDKWLKRMASKSEKIIFAWGINGKAYRRCDEVINMFPTASYLGDKAFWDFPLLLETLRDYKNG